ncbi:MAG: hypothetical protein EAY76_05420 [Alphaproteobacteria bacterium]|nr:MAG: hypothetical protein EAY76_05420 [Alphaproteobacteria bacterium]TAF75495.1 MAG: hypothetical protein EAZ52_06615 [Alphaproteobacteria bacterium]
MGGLAGCIHSSRVQLDYIEVRDECRSISENSLSERAAKERINIENTPQGAKNRNALLAQIFSECMRERGWTVAAPRSAKRPPAPPPAQPAQPTTPPNPIRYMPAETPMPAGRRPINPAYSTFR